MDGSGYRLEALTTGGTGLEAFVIRPPAEFADEFRAEHDGEELLFVVDGAVEVRFSDRVLALAAGDAVHFPGHLEHQVRRRSRSATVLIAIART